uniref:UNC93-like protein MFSD11 n=1 Tax=Erpetoichthys calabaricus TaxID=27687 RepID=A0A8C4SVI1_ERPCA
MSPNGRSLLNIIILGFSFMFIFTAFQTCGNVEQTVIKSLNATDFQGSGYTSLAIIYGVFSASNLISPSVVAILGPQISLFLSGLVYSFYIAIFIHPLTWTFYTASVLLGIAAAVLWTAQGNVLTINSKDTTIGRNSGIFWALLQFSLFFGNLYIYLAWRGKSHISDVDRRTVFISLTVISLVGGFLFFLIRNPEPLNEPSESTDSLLNADTEESNNKKALQVSVKKEMLLLSPSISYSGLEMTFFSGVYGTCIGAMNLLGDDAKGLIGLSVSLLGSERFWVRCSRFGRNPVVLLGLITHLLAFYLIFLNIASDAPIAPEEGTNQQAYMSPSTEVALLCSFLLGFGDSCFNTQLLSIVGFTFPQDSAPAFAVFKFIQSISAAVAFSYSNYLLLHWQLLILVLSGVLGTVTFFAAERIAVVNHRDSDYDSI